jgi:hypothetical protein
MIYKNTNNEIFNLSTSQIWNIYIEDGSTVKCYIGDVYFDIEKFKTKEKAQSFIDSLYECFSNKEEIVSYSDLI